MFKKLDVVESPCWNWFLSTTCQATLLHINVGEWPVLSSGPLSCFCFGFLLLFVLFQFKFFFLPKPQFSLRRQIMMTDDLHSAHQLLQHFREVCLAASTSVMVFSNFTAYSIHLKTTIFFCLEKCAHSLFLLSANSPLFFFLPKKDSVLNCNYYESLTYAKNKIRPWTCFKMLHFKKHVFNTCNIFQQG